MMLIPVAALLAFAWLAYRAVLTVRPEHVRSLSPVDGALEVARGRLANGEITVDEYWRIARVLRD